jgi:hypothetical protein
MAARRSHRDLRLQFADATQLRAGSDSSPSLETRDRRWVLVGLILHPQRVADVDIDRVRRNAHPRRDPCGETAHQPLWPVKDGDAVEGAPAVS